MNGAGGAVIVLVKAHGASFAAQTPDSLARRAQDHASCAALQLRRQLAALQLRDLSPRVGLVSAALTALPGSNNFED